MESTLLLPWRVSGMSCSHRQQSGLFATSSWPSNFSKQSSRTSTGAYTTVFDAVETIVDRLVKAPAISCWGHTSYGKSNARKYLQRGIYGNSLKVVRRKLYYPKTLVVRAKLKEFEVNPTVAIGTYSVETGDIWSQGPIVLTTQQMSEERIWNPATVLLRSGQANFASISARSHRPPPPVERSKTSKYVTAGVIFSITVWIFWLISKSESYARQQLISREETFATPEPPPEMAAAYERARAAVAQGVLVNRALAAVLNNKLMECTVEMELALQENRLARRSIESDFYEDDQLMQIYQGVLKMWLDGYPPDYGKILQLRSLLDISSQEAEALEQEILQQSDSYVI